MSQHNSNKQHTLDIKIMGKEYRVGCPEGEEEGLIKAAQFLDKKMDEIKQSGKIIGTERIAVMAALNLANDFLHIDSINAQKTLKTEQKVEFLNSKIEKLLSELNA